MSTNLVCIGTIPPLLVAALITIRTDRVQQDNLDYGDPQADVILDREGYANGYSYEKHQPLWVAYRLTANHATNHVCDRSITDFHADKFMGYTSATPSDYTRTGYDRGHIAPAGDMTWSTNAMINSFFMSNMSPQKPEFNRGIWKDLESKVRDFAVKEGSIFLYSGPIFGDTNVVIHIGKTKKVEVPTAYYKVILSEKEPKTMIGFILNNEGSTNSLQSFMTTVDEVERRTGLDFFSRLDDYIEEDLECKIIPNRWF